VAKRPNRKIVLKQVDPLMANNLLVYKVIELVNFVELDIGEYLTKRQAEDIMDYVNMTVVVK
jgi:hypothetical protein